MKTATYVADLLTADFEENTITFLIDGDFEVRAGRYFIFSEKALQTFADITCEKQRENCNEYFCDTWKDIDKEDKSDAFLTFEQWYKHDIILNAPQPKINEL